MQQNYTTPLLSSMIIGILFSRKSLTSYSASGLPQGLTIDSSNGEISGTPTKKGEFTVTVTASDAVGEVEDEFNIAVSTVYRKTQIPDVETNFGNNFNLNVSGNFGFVSSYDANGLPKGLTIDSSSGAISGAPTKSGNFTVTVIASDQGNNEVKDKFNIAVSSRNSSTVLKPFLFGLRLTNLYIGDFNGDKKSDILRQEKWFRDNDNKLTAQVIFSKGDGQFTASTLPESFALKGDETNLYIGDFDGDGKSDILRQEKGRWDEDKGTAHVLLSEGDGTFTPSPLGFALKGNLYIGDFDGDGKSDILRQKGIAIADLLLSEGNGTFTRSRLDKSFALDSDETNLYIGDFNGDGKSDILRQENGRWDENEETAHVLLSQGDGQFSRSPLDESFALDGDETNLYIGDFNGDKKSDILRQEKGNGNNNHVLLSQGDGQFSRISLGFDLEYDLLYVEDLDADGKDEILVHEESRLSQPNRSRIMRVLSLNDDGENFTEALLPSAPQVYGQGGQL
ncbi:MAG: VCBS repeat-containing protein [Hormoscilla sp. GUM202]|nr:VCBS repeat-containing protein [Hormoscilla sp. GUM202]